MFVHQYLTSFYSSFVRQVDEAHSLQIVQLAKLLLEGCSSKEMESILEYDGRYPEMHFPTLFFDDLVSYLERRNKDVVSSATPPVRKQSSTITPEFNHPRALTARLQIIRFVFGLGFGPVNGNPNMPQMELSKDQINDIWDVCLQPADQSAYMVFLATASKGDDCKCTLTNMIQILTSSNILYCSVLTIYRHTL